MLQIGTPQESAEITRRVGWSDWLPTALAGVLVGAGGIGLLFASSTTAIDEAAALGNLIDGAHWLAATAIGASVTVAALTLTTLSLLESVDRQGLDSRFLFHLRAVIAGAFGAIVCSLGVLLVSLLPASVEVRVPLVAAPVAATLSVLCALTAGAFTVMLASLYRTVADLLRNLPRAVVEEILAEPEIAEAGERCDEGSRPGPLLTRELPAAGPASRSLR